MTDINNDFNEVDQICKQFSVNWKEIGGKLGISRNTIEIIAKDNNKVKQCMSELIAQWLRRDTPEQPLPTWRILCEAIATVADRTAADKIARDKGFNITQTGIIFIIMACTLYLLSTGLNLFLRGIELPGNSLIT